MRRIRSTAAALATLGLAATGVVVGTAGTAQAATHCSGFSKYSSGSSAHVRKPTTVNGSFNTSCLLSNGDGFNGGNQVNAVGWLQFSLNKCFGAGLSVDGMYGQATANAVKTVQRVKGIPQDGVFGPQTSRHMNWARMGTNGGFISCTSGG